MMEGYPSRLHLVMEATIEGEKLYFVGYKYNTSKVLYFYVQQMQVFLKKENHTLQDLQIKMVT